MKIEEIAPELFDFGVDSNGIIDSIRLLMGDHLQSFRQSPWYQRFYSESPLGHNEILETCNNLVESLTFRDDPSSDIGNLVREGLNGSSVLYLPTYRRIEAEMPGDLQKMQGSGLNLPWHTPGRFQGKPLSSSWKMDQLIYFGLEDVEKKLKSIEETIKRGTFDAYTRIGGKTLEQLCGLGSTREAQIDINSSDLKVVLARLGKAGGQVEKIIINLIEDGNIKDENNKYLYSFLSQLLEVYASNKEQENSIEEFTELVNSYLIDGYDKKEFVFDKLEVSTNIKSTFSGEALPLNALSSGEKQIVSIFARLYLSEKSKYVVLIDEPELSLSMAWQKRFLPDILKSPSCQQLIGITHSPFIFENELDPYAGPLIVSNHQQ